MKQQNHMRGRGQDAFQTARTAVLVFFLNSLLCSFVFAQTETGGIEGTVKDSEGRPIPGATIIASSPSLIGASTTTYSAQDGFYRFPGLTSGTYSVQAKVTGFRHVTQNGIRVFAGKTLTVDFDLELEAVTEALEVSAKPPLIDVSTTAVSVSVPPEIIANLPKQNIENLFALTPGIGDDLVTYGADPHGIHATIDGVSVGSPNGRDSWVNGPTPIFVEYDYNWIDEFQITGIGAPAEFGRFTGVTGTFITRSGSNQFHGLFETFFHNENLTSTNLPDPDPEVPFQSFDISTQLGGPILRDKLWFFSGVQHGHNETYVPLYDVSTNIDTKIIEKLTYKWNENNNLYGLLNLNIGSSEGGAGPDVLPEATSKGRNVQSSWNLSWISLLNSQTNFEARFGGFHNHFYNDEDRPDVPGHLDLGTGISSVNDQGSGDVDESRIQINGALSHYAADFLQGSHDFKFGVQYERSDAFANDYQLNGGFFYFDYYGQPFQRLSEFGRQVDGTNESTAVYAQDDWNITDRLNVSLGVRWDHNRGITDRGVVFATDPVAPRIGAVWMLNKENQTVIKVHYGDYYEALVNRYFAGLSDERLTQVFEQFNPETGQWEGIGTVHRIFVGEKKFKQPFMREFTLGVDRVLPGEIPVGIHYIHRRYGNFVEDIGISDYEELPFVNPLTGETITVFNRLGTNPAFLVTNPDELFRRYHGIQFTASKYLFRNLSVQGSIVYSRSTGNAVARNSTFLDTPNTLINFPGRLVNDPTIAWKIVGSYAFPLGFNTGWYLRHESGDTWAATGNPRLPCCPTTRIFLEPAGSRRFPSYTLLDMRVEKQFRIYTGQIRFTLDVFNVFNSSFAVNVQDRFERPDFGIPNGFTEPRTMRLGIRYTF